ncbi:VOC family protein [Allosphingosinicella deserti]|uniref:VOC family protein n=1 Tax=Allosphingosinicella deserti TaxID=2116704 RepID=A0A2P7QI95_9SPHN|nr:VOC family protein [Sphingomonas deserti]PSJ37688.1 VOC family protein [Sphingomonas deserti]
MASIRNWLLDHTGIGVANIQASLAFYQGALRPLGAKPIMCISREMGPSSLDGPNLGGVGFGVDYPVFWIDVFHPHGVRQHTAFRAETRKQVDSFHKAALEAGGTDNGAPGPRTGGYYAAFVFDPDGNNVEAVFRDLDL